MNCECDICKNQRKFIMPKEVIEAAKNGELVLFCGAGISTENKTVLPFSFYEEVQDELNVKDNNLSFSELMQLYCDKPDGRVKLIKKIKNRFNYIHSFPEIENLATRFHKELAEQYYIRTIITTNWDTYFESYCAATPIVTPADYRVWDENDRSVLKIHGSISNIGSIIATQDDYEICAKNLEKGIIGSELKRLLAKKIVVFIGFSFGDDDFTQIMDFIQSEFEGFIPHIYIVTIDERLCSKVNYKNATYIVTDGTYFLHMLKLEMINQGLLERCNTLPIIEGVNDYLHELHEKVSSIDMHRYPSVIWS